MTDHIRLAHCGDMAGLGRLWHDAVHKGAIGAYADGARIAVKRMPAGYRKSVIA